MSDAPRLVNAGTYAELLHFYAAQSQAFDDGAVAAWVDTFTADAYFATHGLSGVVAHGRHELGVGLDRVTTQRQADGIVLRHVLGTIVAEVLDACREDDNAERVRTRSYALIIETPPGGSAAVKRSTVCTDELVRSGGRWLVRRRDVRLDGA